MRCNRNGHISRSCAQASVTRRGRGPRHADGMPCTRAHRCSLGHEKRKIMCMMLPVPKKKTFHTVDRQFEGSRSRRTMTPSRQCTAKCSDQISIHFPCAGAFRIDATGHILVSSCLSRSPDLCVRPAHVCLCVCERTRRRIARFGSKSCASRVIHTHTQGSHNSTTQTHTHTAREHATDV